MKKLKEPCRSCGKPIDPRLAGVPVLRGRDRRPPHRRPRGPAGVPAPDRRRAGGRAGCRALRANRRRRARSCSTPSRLDPERRASSTSPASRRRTGAGPTSSQPLPKEHLNGPNPDPGEARRLRARPDRRGDRPLRAQGAADRRAEADAGRPRRWPSATTPSTPRSRSSASWSSSSRAARWSRWCSREPRP